MTAITSWLEYSEPNCDRCRHEYQPGHCGGGSGYDEYACTCGWPRRVIGEAEARDWRATTSRQGAEP